MNYFYGLSATIIGVAVVVMIPNPVATAELNQQVIGNIAQEVTVMIDGQNPGSGVIIGKEGNNYSILTAQHVVPREDEYEVVTPDQKRYLLDYHKVKLLPDVDLALLEFSSQDNYPVAKLGNSDQVTLGKRVYVAGWPHPEAPITESIFTFAEGSIAARPPRPLPEGYQLIYTNITRSGMSGGPVLNEEGELIGIHGQAQGREVALPEFETGQLKTGFNLGIPINTFVSLAEAGSINLAKPPKPETGQIPDRERRRPEPVFFTEAPSLVEAVTTQSRVYVRGATYYFTVDLPANAGVPLQQITLEQREGVEFLEWYHIDETRAFEGTRKDKGKQISLGMVAADREKQTVTISFDPPVPPGRKVTVGLRPVFTPKIGGVYLFRVTVFPPGEGGRGLTLGTARLQFYESRR